VVVKLGERNRRSTEDLLEERASSGLRYAVPAEAAQGDLVVLRAGAANEYVIELDVAGRFLWWWSLFDVIELAGVGADAMTARPVAPAAAARVPRLSQGGAIRAGRRAARRLSAASGSAAVPAQLTPRLSRRAVLVTLILVLAAVVAGGLVLRSLSHSANPRTEVLRSATPLSDIWVRITGPGGAVSYISQRFMSGDRFSRFTFRQASVRGEFLPPDVRERKLCASTHVIQPGDAAQLQKWQGKTLAITIYGSKTSTLYCAVLGYGLYLG
jgi:hypothetical protein